MDMCRRGIADILERGAKYRAVREEEKWKTTKKIHNYSEGGYVEEQCGRGGC